MSDHCIQQLTDEQRTELEKTKKKKEQSRIRSQRYYEKHKHKVLNSQKLAREKKSNQNKQIQNELQDCYNNEPQSDYTQMENEVIEQPVDVSNLDKIDFTKAELLALIKNDKSIVSEKTRDTYYQDIIRVFQVSGCDDFKKCLTNYKKMMNSIINSKKPIKPIKPKKLSKKKQKEAEEKQKETEKEKEPEPEPEAYAINTIKQTIQSIMFVGTQYMNDFKRLFNEQKASNIKKYFDTQFQKYKELSRLELEEKQQNTEYPTFDEYLGKVLEKYGENSKEYMVSYLYSLFTVRDNFKAMTLIDNKKSDDGKNNFLLITRTKIMFIVNDFKTKRKYEKLEYTVTDEKLKDLLKQWIENPKNVTNRKKNGNYLLGKTSLSPFISQLNKSLGYTNNMGGINIYRHMRVSDIHTTPNITFEERKKLADTMAHSITVASDYIRKNNLKVSDSKLND